MKELLKKIGLMAVLWIALWLVSLFIFCAIPAANQEVTNYDDNGEPYVETEIKESWSSAGLLIAFGLTLVSIIVIDYNKVQRLKANIPGCKNDVIAYEEKRTHQLDQANRVLDKYLMHEQSVQEASAQSHVNTGAEFTAVIEAHPELKANQAVETLMNQINQVENDLVMTKSLCNRYIAEYNASIHTFPLALFRKLLKLDDMEMAMSDTVINTEQEITDEDLGI